MSNDVVVDIQGTGLVGLEDGPHRPFPSQTEFYALLEDLEVLNNSFDLFQPHLAINPYIG